MPRSAQFSNEGPEERGGRRCSRLKGRAVGEPGESAALRRRMPWTNRLFSKSMEGKILNFLYEVEKMVSVISVQV